MSWQKELIELLVFSNECAWIVTRGIGFHVFFLYEGDAE